MTADCPRRTRQSSFLTGVGTESTGEPLGSLRRRSPRSDGYCCPKSQFRFGHGSSSQCAILSNITPLILSQHGAKSKVICVKASIETVYIVRTQIRTSAPLTTGPTRSVYPRPRQSAVSPLLHIRLSPTSNDVFSNYGDETKGSRKAFFSPCTLGVTTQEHPSINRIMLPVVAGDRGTVHG